MKPLFWNCEVGKISGKERTMKRLQIKAERSKKEVSKLSPGDILERGRVHSRNLDHFTKESDDLLDKMQTSEARKGMKAVFNASPDKLGHAAVKAWRKHR
jgi:hypothetical protein